MRWRVVGLVFAVVFTVLIFIPPYQSLYEFIYGPAAVFGFLSLGRGYQLANTWWFWMFGAIFLFELSGLQIQLENIRFPEGVLPQISMILGGCGFGFATLVFMQKLFIEIVHNTQANDSQNA